MTHTYDTLPPPPDGFGDWHAWDAEAFEFHKEELQDVPNFLNPHDMVFYAMEDGEITETPDPARTLNWCEAGIGTITHFCLNAGHPYNFTIPEPMKPMLDMTGMDEFSLWGTF